MNLQEQINRIQSMMGVNESFVLRRRVDYARIEVEFINALDYVVFNLNANANNWLWDDMTLNKFTDVVITVMMDGIHGVLSDWGTKDFPYNEISDYLREIYSDRIKQRYNEIMN